MGIVPAGREPSMFEKAGPACTREWGTSSGIEAYGSDLNRRCSAALRVPAAVWARTKCVSRVRQMINFDLSLDDRVDCLQVRRISHQRNMHLQAIPWHDSLWWKLECGSHRASCGAAAWSFVVQWSMSLHRFSRGSRFCMRETKMVFHIARSREVIVGLR